MTRFGWVAGFAVLLGACGGGQSTRPGRVTPTVDQTLQELFNLTAAYQRIGRLAGGDPVRFVGNVAYLGGRNDSTVAQVGVSLDNHALIFQRASTGFEARYRVEMTFTPAVPGKAPISFARDEVVLVGNFTETQRNDETIIVQQGFLLAPGDYHFAVVVRDQGAGRASQAEQDLRVPAFGAGSITAPILVYEASERATRSDDVNLLLNPRGAVVIGGDSLLVYVEAYDLDAPRDVPITIRDDRDSVALQTTLRFDGGRRVEGRTVRIPPDAPPLGLLTIAAGTATRTPTGELVVEAGAGREVTALVSFSRTWVVTNYDNLLSLLRFFGHNDELDALRKAEPALRARLWREFWDATDPNPNTPENEALDQYFTRVAIANERFREEGPNSGWQSDRGEVYITLGEPDQIAESSPAAETRITDWLYRKYNSVLRFTGAFGATRMRLTPASRAEFSRLRALVQSGRSQ